MKWTAAILVLAALTVMTSSCVRRVYVNEHRFTISDVSEGVANDIERELKEGGYRVRTVSANKKGEILGREDIEDRTFVLESDGYTDEDVRKVTAIVTNPRRNEPIALRYTAVQQDYVSAAGAGTASVEVSFDLTENARAYFKATGQPVQMRRLSGQQTATFSYRRQKGEEYVDIYVVPEGAGPGYKPRTFHRISLSYPYADRVLPWESCWTRFWKWVRSIFGSRRTEDRSGS
ncbi:MAG: hypothetical protein ABIL25_01090 [candidate division WOR-3 bacterium]